jgi:L-lysine 6-transaminase
MITAVRGRGLLVAFDLPDTNARDEFYRGLYDKGMLGIRCGERSIRFRPALDIDEGTIVEALQVIEAQCMDTENRGASRQQRAA